MKYQQLENLECGWKWQYLMNRWKDGSQITKYVDTSEIDHAVSLLKEIEHEPVRVLEWIENHMSPELENKLKQAIRAKRKRHYNAEQIHTRKNPLIWITGFGKSFHTERMSWVVHYLMPSNICYLKHRKQKSQPESQHT